jgi:hypothetical protein
MHVSRIRASAVLAAWLLTNGCTTMREIPRSDYEQLPEGRNVRVETRDGLVYDFDYATVSGDSLSGVRHRNDLEGPVDETVTFQIALDDIQQLTTRRFDWYRTGLVSGSVVAAVLVGALGVRARNSDNGNGNGGGGKPPDPK